mmetsp:Transcript_22265/g.88384  ORF Transcript_22265/g.88384 Transcript_22265/m.88384 type:complete len:284 (-) Transcript_22265:42-893(-)
MSDRSSGLSRPLDARFRPRFGHHKTGWAITHELVNQLKAHGFNDVAHGGTWFGQPLANAEFEKLSAYVTYPCMSCFHGHLDPERQHVVNAVRDPLEMVVSGYLYHFAGQEAWMTSFSRGGERGGDLRVFKAPPAFSGLPPSTGYANYPEYLKALPADRGVLAEMLRVLEWELPELLSSVRTTRKYATFHSVCLEDCMRDGEATLEHLFAAIGVDTSLAPRIAPAVAPEMAAEHGTQPHSDREARFRDTVRDYVRSFDATHFNDTFLRASAEVNCTGDFLHAIY